MRILLAILFILPAATAADAAGAPIASNRNPPLFFIPNQGQAPQDVQFMAKGSALTAYFLTGEVALRATGAPVRIQFVGSAAGARIEGADPLPGRVNFLTGPQDQWRTGLPIYGAVAYRGLYAGIDMTYGTNGRQLKSEFTIAAGADSRQIRIRYLGAGPARVDADGSLLVAASSGTLRELPPTAYQDRAGKRVPVEARFELQSDGTVGFTLGRHDPLFPLVIDPVLSYSTLLGGSGADAANAIAVDSTGAAYVAGFTASFDFPTVNPEQGATGGGNDAFIAKLSASGSALIYCTYLGGRGDDRAFGIAVDATGAAYVTGSTQSTNFPVRNALQANLAGGKNAFVAKLTPTGNGLAYSTYLGGNGSDAGNGIAVDSSGNAYITGDTTSSNFPANTYQTTYHGSQDAFVSKLNAAGSALTYSTYLGGGSIDHGAAIAVDSTGTAYITGSTYSTDFPTLDAMQPAIGGGQNAFITRLKADGSGLLFSTYLGGSGGSTGYPESGQGIAVDAAGSAYVAGVTPSPNFPLVNPEQSTLNGSLDAFVTKVSSTGTLVYSTYLGGSGIDNANAIAVDTNGYAYVGGYTYSSDFPVVSPVQATAASPTSIDAFVAKLVPAGNTLAFSTYLGGNDSNTVTGVAIDPSGNVYVAGWTLSTNFPTLNAYQTQNGGNYGAFVTKYLFNAIPANVSVAPNSGSGTTQSFTFQYSDGNGAINFSTVAASFNTTASQAGACAVIFNPALNTLALLTDSGAQPVSPIAPGSGTAQNSQCVLNGGASSVSLSGDILTLTLALSFQPAFGGAKNIYMQAANPYQTTAWQAEGTWTVAGTIALAVTPSSGNATQQTFAFQYTDSIGATDLTTVGALFDTTSSSVAAACMVTYNRAQNTLALATDAGAQPASTITPGSGTQQNSQCVLSGASSNVTVAGNVLTLNLAITFQPSLAGTKNAYMDAAGQFTALPWTQVGTWTVPAQTLLVSPPSGTGLTQTFVFTVSDIGGYTDLTAMEVVINSNFSGAQACYLRYDPPSNELFLVNDAGNQFMGPTTPGASATLSNSQCSLNVASSAISGNGNTLTVTVPITFTQAFAGNKNVYMWASTVAGVNTGYQQRGTWTVARAAGIPGVVSVTPSSGSGGSGAFQFVVSDTSGFADLTAMEIVINSNFSGAQACYLRYDPPSNQLFLVNDAGNQFMGPATPGASATLSNSQCSVNVASVSVAASGNALTLAVLLVFTGAFAGAKNVYLWASSASGQNSGYQQRGTWTVAGVAGVPGVVSVTPSSGSGASGAFQFVVSDTSGFADLTAMEIVINSNFSGAQACYLRYDPPSNQLFLVNDAGNQFMGPATLGASATLSNSQCSLNVASSAISGNGNTLTVTVPITFTQAFAGNKNVYMWASTVAGVNTGYQQRGTWTVATLTAAVVAGVPGALSVTPSSGSGASGAFQFVVSDTSGFADLTAMEIVINSSFSGAQACYLRYDPPSNQLFLVNDAGNQFIGPATPGASATLSNSQCSVNVASVSVAASGNALTLAVPLVFTGAFAGAKNVYLWASSASGQNSGYQQRGAWTVAE
jgi:hypothetical protein